MFTTNKRTFDRLEEREYFFNSMKYQTNFSTVHIEFTERP